MNNKEKTPIAQSFYIDPVYTAHKEDLGYDVYKYAEQYIYESIKSWDDFCIDSLYKEYQKLGITKVFVINREEFKKFLLWGLPEYNRRFKDDKFKDDK